MNEEVVQQLLEEDYVQIGKLEYIRIRPLRETNGVLNDVDIEIARRIPRYDFGSEEPHYSDDIFRWSVSGKWEDILDPNKEVLLSHGFTKDTNSILGASYLSPYKGRRYSVKLNHKWDFMIALKQFKGRPRYNCLYRYGVCWSAGWEILEWVKTETNKRPGNIWDAKWGEEVVESHKSVGFWKRLD